jgi:hypothetical protein
VTSPALAEGTPVDELLSLDKIRASTTSL